MTDHIHWERTKHDNGKYLGYFEDKDEAEAWVEKQFNRYIYTPNPGKMSVARLCREAQEEGIALHEQTMNRWMDRAGIKKRTVNPRETTRGRGTFTVSKIVLEEMEGYPNKSYLVDLGLRLVLGIPTEDVVVILPDEEQGAVTLIFRKKKEGRIQMWTSGTMDRKFEQQVRQLMQRTNHQGMQAVVDYAQTNGYAWYGGTKI